MGIDTIFMVIRPKLLKLLPFRLIREDGGRVMEVTTCDNMPILKSNCKYISEKAINKIFDPENMGIGTTFMEIGPKLTNL